MSNFAELKRKSQTNFDFLQKELQKSTNAKNSGDERLWKPALDATGNGYAVVRFLPAPEGETLPWAKLYNHAFQGPGGWFIENSLTTLGQQDPVSAANNKLWNSGVESDKEIARIRKRKLSYYSNIYVVKDSANPDNEGKVFLYKYGKKIHDKVLAAMQPEFDDETPVNPFDLWEGANFKLKIRTIGGYWNYDASEFASPTALSTNDDEMEALWKQAHSLEAFTAPSEFKSYEALEQRMNAVLGVSRPVQQAQYEEEADPIPTSGGFNDPSIMAAPAPSVPATDSADDDALSYFQRLAEE